MLQIFFDYSQKATVEEILDTVKDFISSSKLRKIF